ncbi:pentapeptide repeat-containing protein [Streptomyces chattanoogensis]
MTAGEGTVPQPRQALVDRAASVVGAAAAQGRRLLLVSADALGRTRSGARLVPGTDVALAPADAPGGTAGELARSGLGLRTLALIEAPEPGQRADKAHVVTLVDGWQLLRETGHGLDLADADLRGADLRGAELRGTGAAAARFDGADLTKADLHDAQLESAGFSGANLSRAGLWGADLRQADLRRADLSHADLRHAVLTGASLRGAELWACYVWGVDFEHAHTDGCALNRADRRG